MTVRVRSAPSPTGHLHIGGARSALFNFLLAKKERGSYVLRIEDTDKERSRADFEESIFGALEWLGLIPDEGPIQGGSFGPYRQSERSHIYRSAIERLLQSGHAFYCDHPGGEGEEAGAHWCSYADQPMERPSGIIRFKTPKDRIVAFSDIIRGDIETHTDDMGNFSLAKGLDLPLYNLAAAVDDSSMQITHVLRGEEHVANTPKQILILEALDLPIPRYAHLPLVLGEDRAKLSQRHGATSVLGFKEKGYLPEALLNFLALLGWNPGGDREIFSMDELIRLFSLDRVHKAGAVLDTAKLDWMNGEYIRALTVSDLTDRMIPFLHAAGIKADSLSREKLEAVIALEQPRLKILSEIGERVGFYFNRPNVDPELLRWKSMSGKEVAESLGTARDLISAFDEPFPRKADLESKLLAASEAYGDRGRLLWPFRVALTGLKSSPGPFDVAAILGRDESIARIDATIASLTG